MNYTIIHKKPTSNRPLLHPIRMDDAQFDRFLTIRAGTCFCPAPWPQYLAIINFFWVIFEWILSIFFCKVPHLNLLHHFYCHHHFLLNNSKVEKSFKNLFVKKKKEFIAWTKHYLTDRDPLRTASRWPLPWMEHNHCAPAIAFVCKQHHRYRQWKQS